jgi:putative two-component system response regulator
LLALTSPLHDLGRIGIPDHILRKPDRLTPEERRLMQEHCRIGARILEGADEDPLLAMASTIALSHHEWWDGSGYPQGLAGEGIPLAARIVALADVYDALCSARPYKDAFSRKQVFEHMRRGAGRQFDPGVYAVFERSIDQFEAVRRGFGDPAHDEPGPGPVERV